MEPIKTTVDDLDPGIGLGRNRALALGARGHGTTVSASIRGDAYCKNGPPDASQNPDPSPQPAQTEELPNR